MYSSIQEGSVVGPLTDEMLATLSIRAPHRCVIRDY
jgi:hypothetical protein